jgi:membrane protease subunit HflK
MIGEKIYRFREAWIARLVALVVVLIVVFSSLYAVDADEVGVVLRFGQYVREAESGLHARIPFGIETVRKVSIKRVFKEEFGFRSTVGTGRTTYQSEGLAAESLMLTGDLNVADVEWIIQYRVLDPVKYLFKLRDPEHTLRAMSEAIMRRVVGDRSVTEVLTVGRVEIAKQVEVELQELMDLFESGIQIVTVKLQDVNPPDPVKPAFNEVNQAKQDQERLLNEAWEEYNKAVPQARGEAERTIAKAEGYALDRVNRAKGDAARFRALYKEYRDAKEVTRQRLYLETIQQVFPKLKEIYVVDETQKTILPLLDVAGKGGDGK